MVVQMMPIVLITNIIVIIMLEGGGGYSGIVLNLVLITTVTVLSQSLSLQRISNDEISLPSASSSSAWSCWPSNFPSMDVSATPSAESLDKIVLLLLLLPRLDCGWPCPWLSSKETPKLPSALPAVSGNSFTEMDVTIPTENMTIPMVRRELSLDTINGQVIPPTRPSALAVERKGKIMQKKEDPDESKIHFFSQSLQIEHILCCFSIHQDPKEQKELT